MHKAIYDPSRFTDIESVDEAIGVILTEEEGLSSRQRWEIEAPELMKLIERHIKKGSTVLGS